jgi:hypothetical protein
MVESSPDTLSGCRLFTWRIVDLTWKPQSNHPHRLFVRNRNIFSSPLSLTVFWRLVKEQASLLCISSHHHSLSFCFILLPLLEIVFHVVVAFQACVLSSHCFSNLCFISLSLLNLVFHHLVTWQAHVSSHHHSPSLCFVMSLFDKLVFSLLAKQHCNYICSPQKLLRLLS